MFRRRFPPSAGGSAGAARSSPLAVPLAGGTVFWGDFSTLLVGVAGACFGAADLVSIHVLNSRLRPALRLLAGALTVLVGLCVVFVGFCLFCGLAAAALWRERRRGRE